MLLFSIALHLSVLFLVLFSIVLFPQASSALLHPYLQCEHSAAQIAKVDPLARVSGLPYRACSMAVLDCMVSGAFSSWFVWDCVPPPSPPFTYLGNWGVAIVLHFCSHLGSFYLPVVFSFLNFNGFYYYYYYYIYYYFILVYFDRLPLNVFQCDWCPCLCYLILFCLSLH